MHEVERRPRLEAGHEVGIALPADRLPANVGDLELRRIQAGDLAAQNPDALVAAQFPGALEQELEPEADAQHGGARLHPGRHQPVQAQLPDPRHRPGKGAHTGKDHSGGPLRLGRLARDEAVRPDPPERLLDGPQVAHPVVEDRDHDQ